MIRLITRPHLITEIKYLLNDCSRITILSAYLSNEAVSRVFNNTNCEIEIMTSLYQECVEPKALETLLSLKAQIFIYSGQEFFHPKVYYFHLNNPVVILGSSNFTTGGLDHNLELNLICDDPLLIDNIYNYIKILKVDPRFGLLTPDALMKYKDLYSEKVLHQQKQLFIPKKEDLIEINRLLYFAPLPQEETNLESPRIIKWKISHSSDLSREKWGVVVANKKKNVVYGNPRDFFPQKPQHFEIQCTLSGYKVVSFESHLTKSNHISGLVNKLLGYNIKLIPGDNICFEELESKKLYRFWIEKS